VSFKNAFTAMKSHFSDVWGDRTPIAWPNVEFERPADAPWVRFSVVDESSKLGSVGSPASNVVRSTGKVTVRIFVPVLTGEEEGRELADGVVSVFQGRCLGEEHIRFGTASLQVASKSAEESFVQMDVTIPYRYDELG